MMDRFLIKKLKLSEELPGLNTNAHRVNVEELPCPSSNSLGDWSTPQQVAPEPGPPIILRVLGPDGSCIRIKMKMLAPFQKLMKIYCKRTGFILEALRFRFDGNVIFESYTPYSMNLSDGDTIEVFQSMVGGTIFLNR
ncbi:small ubiquitin-related modifier 2-A-like isoform X1 [Myzus persicae]|uniref:small ubiquitin-related modifier 2-A-like isoform X1 n=1 Tax=Myzus persicae TaxID=13164 RepID=UPI000B933D54|nr:small ubiquitin-related modifier 2-A-like isoform X1 [Myzus persicae]